MEDEEISHDETIPVSEKSCELSVQENGTVFPTEDGSEFVFDHKSDHSDHSRHLVRRESQYTHRWDPEMINTFSLLEKMEYDHTLHIEHKEDDSDVEFHVSVGKSIPDEEEEK